MAGACSGGAERGGRGRALPLTCCRAAAAALPRADQTSPSPRGWRSSGARGWPTASRLSSSSRRRSTRTRRAPSER
eukprot:6496496-Prymnesium_polylepis.1